MSGREAMHVVASVLASVDGRGGGSAHRYNDRTI